MSFEIEMIGWNRVAVDIERLLAKEYRGKFEPMIVFLAEREMPFFDQPAELRVMISDREILAFAKTDDDKIGVAIEASNQALLDALFGRNLKKLYRALAEAYKVLDGDGGAMNAVLNFGDSRIDVRTDEASVDVDFGEHGSIAMLTIPVYVDEVDSFVLIVPVGHNRVSPIQLATSNPMLMETITMFDPDCDIDEVIFDLATQITENIRDSRLVSGAVAEYLSDALSEHYEADIEILPNGVLMIEDEIVGKNCLGCIELQVRDLLYCGDGIKVIENHLNHLLLRHQPDDSTFH